MLISSHNKYDTFVMIKNLGSGTVNITGTPSGESIRGAVNLRTGRLHIHDTNFGNFDTPGDVTYPASLDLDVQYKNIDTNITADNINIIRDENNAIGLSISSARSFLEATLNNLTVNLTGENSWIAHDWVTEQDEGKNVIIKDSSLSAENGFAVTDYDARTSNATREITLENTTVKTNGYLIYVEPSTDQNKYTLNAIGSTLSGRTQLTSAETGYPLGFDYTQLGNNYQSRDVLPLGTEVYPMIFNFDNTTWNVTDNSGLSELNMQGNSNVIFDDSDDEYNTLWVQDQLSGSGTFEVSTDLINRKSDKIILNDKSEGHFNVVINNTDAVPDDPNHHVPFLVINGPSTATFGLSLKYEDLGAYRYRVYQKGNEWVFGNRYGELSEYSNALASIRQAELLHFEQSLVGIHDRLGELKQGKQSNVWVRNYDSRLEFDSTAVDSESRTSGFTQNYYSLQIGADTAINDLVQVGGFIGTARSKVDYNGDYGEGTLNSQMLGLYATLHTDNDLYWDNIAKYERVRVKSDGVDSHHLNGYQLSTELGKGFKFDSWTVTPNAQLVWLKTQATQGQSATSSLYTRAGLRVAKAFDFGSFNLQPYAEVNTIHVKNSNSDFQIGKRTYDIASSGNRVETALGLNAQTGNHRFGLEIKRANGNRVDEKLALQAVYRYSW
ncbi:autotransporter outer membrane beta-barrel domain-containing protein [Lonepinella sp. BR2271]|uniref:autotransporter outer membrane beta-barrel domain-containing protein n=1 Tax=Lonepinella sp. BR2271 TaxID=3434550 RepID=UPI003F6DB197